jgi:hypothetical protein
VLSLLHQRDYRVMHFAGHGVHEHELSPGLLMERKQLNASGDLEKIYQYQSAKVRSGMVLSDTAVLTPGDVEQLRVLPELVFINCCYLGATQGDTIGLAANLGVAFIRMGVKAVVVAGWAVNDAAAKLFAQVFYRHMLQGVGFGEATRKAREECHQTFSEHNTWGAYQCYGDPEYTLTPSGGTRSRQWPAWVSSAQLLNAINNERAYFAASTKPRRERRQDSLRHIDSMRAAIPNAALATQWLKHFDIAMALSELYADMGEYAQAVQCLSALSQISSVDSLSLRDNYFRFQVRALCAVDFFQADKKQLADLNTKLSALIHEYHQGFHHHPAYNSIAQLTELGSALKRYAMCSTDDSPLDALILSARVFKQAAEKLGNQTAYDTPFSNYLICAYLAQVHYRKQRKKQKLNIPGATLKDLGDSFQMRHWQDYLQQLRTPETESGKIQHASTGVKRLNLILLQALDEQRLSPLAHDEFLNTIRDAQLRGLNTWQIDKFLNQLMFLSLLLKQPAPPLADQFKALYLALAELSQ